MAVTTVDGRISHAERTPRSLLRSAGVATAAGAAAAELFTLAARAAGVPMTAADPGAAAAKAIPVGGIALAVIANAAFGIVVAVLCARWLRSPARAFAGIATTYAALSLLGPAFAAHTHTATKLVLTVAHVIAAVVIIPRVTDALRPQGR